MDTELSLGIVLLSFKLSEVGTLKFSVLCTDDIILERLAAQLGCMASWKDERLLRGPAQEDRRGRRGGDAHGRGRSHLRRGHLVRQALRGDLPRGEVAGPEEASRLQAQA